MLNYGGMDCAKRNAIFRGPLLYLRKYVESKEQYLLQYLMSFHKWCSDLKSNVLHSRWKQDYPNIYTHNNFKIQAITWPDAIQWNAIQLTDLQCLSIPSSCDSFKTNSRWCLNVNKMSDQPVWWGLWVAIDKAGVEKFWTISASQDSDTKWTEHFGRPRRQRRLEFCLNSYILYEFVIEKSHYVHQRHIGINISLPNIAYSTRDII